MTLPVFLSIFFMLLFLVKFACTEMLLDYAVNETAKEIAAAAYPISFINELEDEKIEDYGSETGEPGQQAGISSNNNIFNMLISGDIKDLDTAEALKDIVEYYSNSIAGGLIDRITPAYWEMKSAGKYAIAEAVIGEHLDSPLIEMGNLRLSMIEFPQSKSEYDANCKGGKYGSCGLTPIRDFSIDDVVVQLEYDYRVRLPFLEAFEVKMVHTAVERAWVNGSFGILTAEEEGFYLEPEGTIVYITRTGIRYHKGSCWHLRRSRMPVDIEDAKGRGYTPCRVCKPPA